MRFERRLGLVIVVLLMCPLFVHAQHHVFARGEDGSLLHFDGASWHSLGGQVVGTPEACSWGPGRIDVFVRGTDNKLYQIALVNGRWTEWIQHEANISSSPTCVSWGANRIDVFAVEATSKAMHTKVWDGTQWSGWIPLGGEFAPGIGPDAVSHGPNDIALVARGMDNRVWMTSYGSSGWSSWGPLGEQRVNSDPGAVPLGGGRVDVFAQGTDNQMMHSTGTAWAGRGGLFTTGDGPDVVAAGTEYVLYVRGSNGELWRGRGGALGFGGWDPVGGGRRIASDPSAVSMGGAAAASTTGGRGRFRVLVTGFKVLQATWDDITSSDGKWDEVFFVVDSATVHPDGSIHDPRALRGAVVIGDTNHRPERRQAGRASDLGGLMEGDVYPPAGEEALRRVPASLGASAGDPPFVAWEGELVEGEKAALIVPTIWEWDPPTHIHDLYLSSIGGLLPDCAQRAARIWGDQAVFAPAAMCATPLRLSTIRIGEAGARPIGMGPAGNQYSFTAVGVGLNYRGAVAATTSGPAFTRVRYTDWEDLKGNYEIFLVVQRLQ